MESADRTDLGRRKFIGAAAVALLAGAVIQISGCSNDEDAPPDIIGRIDNNHGHSAKVTRVQLEAGGGVSLDIQGSSDHNHTVTLSEDDLKAIAAGNHVMPLSGPSNQSPVHYHVVMFN